MSWKDTLKKVSPAAIFILAAMPVYAQDLETETLDDTAAAAAEEGIVVWYESIPPELADRVMNDFKAEHPSIDFNYVTVGGSQRLARITQESMGGGPTADVLTDSAGAIMTLADQNFVRAVDWSMLGFEASSADVPNPYMVRTNAALYVTIYNTNLIDESEVPKTYDAMVDEKFTGRWGTWARPNGIVNLLPAWGEDKTRDFVAELATTKPTLYRAPQAAAEAVGAGEIALAHFIPYHTALPTIDKGAPVEIAFIEPVPVASLYGFLPTLGQHPSAGKLFLSWLAKPEGAASVENATGRGSPFTLDTRLGAQVKGMEISIFDVGEEIESAEKLNVLETEFAEMLQGRR